MATQPPRPSSGTSILEWCKSLWDYLISIRPVPGPGIICRTSSNGTVISVAPKPPEKDTIPPFHVVLHAVADPKSYYVTVGEGKVIPRLTTAGVGVDALGYLACPSIRDEDGYPTEFPITVGQAIFVYVPEDPYGAINGDVDLVVAAADKKSLNYIPGIQEGKYFYKLAEVEADPDDGTARLKPFATGSHIYHVCGLTADVILDDCAGDPYASPPVYGAQILRMSFLSGNLVSLNATETERPLAPTVVRETISPCSETYPPS